MNGGLITIILPTFNSTKIFDRFIFLENPNFCKFHRIELIVCDDSTNQDVFQRVNQIRHYKYLKHERTGYPVDNWNFGLDQAGCEYTWLLHHDEYIQCEKEFVKLIDIIKRSKHEAFLLKLKLNYGAITRLFRSRTMQKVAVWCPKILYLANQFGSPSVFIHRRSSDRYNRNLKWLVDVDFYVRFLQKNTLKCLDVHIYSDLEMADRITNTIQNKFKMHLKELDFIEIKRWERWLFKLLLKIRYRFCSYII